MQSRIVQVQPQLWPSGYGEIIAMLDRPMDWFVAHLSLKTFEGTDNLGDYRAALVQLPSGRRVGLLRHHGDPERGTELHADVADEIRDVVTEVLDALDLPPDTVTWTHDASITRVQDLWAQAQVR